MGAAAVLALCPYKAWVIRSERILLGQHLMQRDTGIGKWTNRMVEPELRGHPSDRCLWLRNQVLVELWQETLDDGAYLVFYGAVRVDLKQWRDAAGPQASTRWYRINGTKTKRAAWARSEDEFSESRPPFDTNALYLKLQMARPAVAKGARTPVASASIHSETQSVNTSTTSPPLQPGAFHFVIPNKPMRCSRKLQSIRVGEIMHQVGVPVAWTDSISELMSGLSGKGGAPARFPSDHHVLKRESRQG